MTGDDLRRARIAAKLSVLALASALGVERRTIFRWESSLSGVPRASQHKIAAFFADPSNRGTFLPNLKGASLRERFDRFTPNQPEDGCWEWRGAKNQYGYGQARIDNKCRLGTHISLLLDGRPRPTPQSLALHSCDNPPCVNPAHLRWGDKRENAADMVCRGRHRAPWMHP